MSDNWRRLFTTQTATMPRLGWRGRWDALLYAVHWHRFLRAEEAPMTFSMYVKAECEVDLTATVWSAQVEHGHTIEIDAIKRAREG